MESSKKHVVLFTSLGLGHIIPFAELARLLATHHSCKVTVVTFPWETNSRQQTILNNLISLSSSSALDIDHFPLTDVVMDDIINDKSLNIELLNFFLMERAKPSLDSALRGMQDRVDAFVFDSFCTAMVDIAKNLGIPCYLFHTCGTSMLVLMLSFPKFSEPYLQKLFNNDLTVCIDGLPILQVEDLPKPFPDPDDDAFARYLDRGRLYAQLDGIFANTFLGFEHTALKVLDSCNSEFLPESLPPIYSVGPVIANGYPASSTVLEWLDNQPKSSVLYVSFGSAATLAKDQITDLALGLKETGQRFLWVLRRPASEDSASTYVKEGDKEFEDLLPEGFLEETKERGIAVSSWVPQMSILGHDSVRGFMYHGGWNSTLESVWHGVATIAWPMFAEQKLNRKVITEEIGCGIGVNMDKDGFVKKEEVERCVTELMEGEAGVKARKVAKELMMKARASVEVGGGSFSALAQAVSVWGRVK